MLKFSLFGIPMAIEGWFWLVTALLGGAARAKDPEDWLEVGVWTGVVLVSVLAHELGHALAGRQFGATPWIRLHGFGGSTYLPGARFTRPQGLWVTAAGPAAGLTLGLAVLGVSAAEFDLPRVGKLAIRDALYVNFFWTFLNLLPIPPLDGGQILGYLLGPRREAWTSAIGFCLAVVLGVWALSKGWIFAAVMLGMFAYHNFRRQPVEGGVITQ